MMQAYFYSRTDAEKARDRLSLIYKVTGPEPAPEVVNDRAWVLNIEVPKDLSLSQDKFPSAEVEDQVIAIVREFNGALVSQGIVDH